VTVVVAPSAIAGRGTFTGTAIPRGTPVPVALALLNHSCEPNLGWDGPGLVTLRDVAADEELTYDYATAVADPGFVLRCHCPSSRCRQMVTGDDWRIPELQARYAGHWSESVGRLVAAAQ
jgi:hypothetical protein